MSDVRTRKPRDRAHVPYYTCRHLIVVTLDSVSVRTSSTSRSCHARARAIRNDEACESGLPTISRVQSLSDGLTTGAKLSADGDDRSSARGSNSIDLASPLRGSRRDLPLSLSHYSLFNRIMRKRNIREIHSRSWERNRGGGKREKR